MNLGNFASLSSFTYGAMCSCNCDKWDEQNLIALLNNDEKPEWWKGNQKICYRLFNKIVEACSNMGGSQEERVKRGLLVLHPNITIPTHIKNLKPKVKNKLTKTQGSGCSVISQLYKESEHKLVSEECRRLGIIEQVLHDILNSKQECENESESSVCSLAFGKTPVITVTNKLVIELSEIREQMS